MLPRLRFSGLIPARAGSTIHKLTSGDGFRAHPRSRGEHAAIDQIGFFPGGLIPARAGSTAVSASKSTPSRAHPRSRGEHLTPSLWVRSRWGSSPLARGAPAGKIRHLGDPGLIPARAGSTHHEQGGNQQIRAHPRSRGEHRGYLLTSHHDMGSSPLARGARASPTKWLKTLGLIPARAGSTVSG